VNVVIGNMRAIGPRPERQFFVSTFRETLPDYDLGFAVSRRNRPGASGGELFDSCRAGTKFDLLYISNYSVMRDIWIALRTIPVVLHGERTGGIKVPSSSPVMAEEQ
jgi:lipopolysaccharide/colanic/teichoic acid biosynthesis glycosyltransferase